MTDALMRRRRAAGWFAGGLLLLGLLGLLGAKTEVSLAGNEATRFATVRAVAEQSTLAIDGRVFRSVDRVVLNGRVYSDKPPLPAVTVGLLYKIPHRLLGWTFERNYGLSIYAVNLCCSFTLLLLTVWLFRRAIAGIRGNVVDKVWLALALGGGSWLFCYSLILNNHTPAALFLLLWFLGLRRHARSSRWPALFWAGLAAGAAGAAELPVGAIIGLCGVPAAAMQAEPGNRVRAVLAYCAGGAVVLAVMGMVNYLAFGTVVPLYLHAGAGTYNSGGFTDKNHLEYWWEALFGRRGVFSYQPLTLAALPALLGFGWKSRPPAERALVAGCGATILFYLAATSEYGGWGYGFRYLIAVLPGLWFLAAQWLLPRMRRSRRLAALAVAAALVGVAAAAAGAYAPFCSIYEGWRSPAGSPTYEVRSSFTANLLAWSFARNPDGWLSRRLVFDLYGMPTACRYLETAYTNLKDFDALGLLLKFARAHWTEP